MSTGKLIQRKGRILILDDLPSWRKVLVNLLQQHGYEAVAVETVEEALAEVQTNLYHVLILDIYMRGGDGDSPNSQGFALLHTLAEKGLTEVVQVIMLSAYGTKDLMRQAFREYKVVDFLEKHEFSSRWEDLLHRIKAITHSTESINLALDLAWPPQTNQGKIARQLRLDTQAARSHRHALETLGEELEDLFCRLFADAQSVRVRPLTPGWSGAGVLQIQPFYRDGGKGRDLLVKFGAIESIATEYANFQKHVQNFISEGRSSVVLHTRRTVHLGGIIYSLLGAGGDQMKDFATFYHESTTAEIKKSLFQLITRTCENWYANRTSLQQLDLAAIYQKVFGFQPGRLEAALNRALQTLDIERRPHVILFNALPEGRTFTNPLPIADQTLACFSHLSISHGDLNPHNMLVDESNRIWLIDFQSTGESHILRDIATLDAVVRFQILQTHEASLEERLAFEEILCSAESYTHLETLDQSFHSDNPALRKAFDTVVYLRTLARHTMSSSRRAEIHEYYIALMYIALNTLRFTETLSTLQRQHALLSASLLADRLK